MSSKLNSLVFLLTAWTESFSFPTAPPPTSAVLSDNVRECLRVRRQLNPLLLVTTFALDEETGLIIGNGEAVTGAGTTATTVVFVRPNSSGVVPDAEILG